MIQSTIAGDMTHWLTKVNVLTAGIAGLPAAGELFLG